jgi:transglutaminase-like putative cysteine protease/predicted glutamine amidotransferase
MPNLLAFSLEGKLAPSFDLRCLTTPGKPPDGLGLGFYPGDEPFASVFREHRPSSRSGHLQSWEHLESSIFVVQIRDATWGARSEANTQPFVRSWSRRDWLFAHAGSLRHQLDIPMGAIFEPVGSTDSERVFCDLLGRFWQNAWRSLGDADPAVLSEWFQGLNQLGGLSCVLSDGKDLLAYADQFEGGLHLGQFQPPYDDLDFSDPQLEVRLAHPGNRSHKGVVICSNPLSTPNSIGSPDNGVRWRLLSPGSLAVIRGGSILYEVGPRTGTVSSPGPGVARTHLLHRPTRSETRRFEVSHKTTYRYGKPVERSMHLLRLIPVHDRVQSLLHSEIRLSVDGQAQDYEDVFGNRVRRVLLGSPYTELTIDARSRVEVTDVDPLGSKPLRGSSTIPLVWMPWHRQVLQPFLLPPELPESQLYDLIAYAMSFVARNDSDLLDTLLDINTTIFREYQYRQYSTTIHTTPYEVFTNRYGVCQDFTNLFICLARLLGVPARYVCGYVYARPQNPNQRMSEASHAWAQVYFPEVGWIGFDPTNGVITQTDHIRVATGRHWVDATPTSGTIYIGGGSETLEVDVLVQPI